jgi:hypothetical protein
MEINKRNWNLRGFRIHRIQGSGVVVRVVMLRRLRCELTERYLNKNHLKHDYSLSNQLWQQADGFLGLQMGHTFGCSVKSARLRPQNHGLQTKPAPRLYDWFTIQVLFLSNDRRLPERLVLCTKLASIICSKHRKTSTPLAVHHNV